MGLSQYLDPINSGVNYIDGIGLSGINISHENLIDVPFIMVRKKGSKYPGALLEQAYKLEYGQDTLVLQEGILGHTSRVIIADDLLATGGSTLATKKLIEQTNTELEAQKSLALQQLETQVDELSQLIKEKLLGKEVVL